MLDIYESVTSRIIEQLEKGTIPWQKPWSSSKNAAYSGVTQKPYSLLNQMVLEQPGPYYTFNQVKAQGGYVKSGEKSKAIVFWSFIEKDEINTKTGEVEKTHIPLLKYYNVFHISQCEGIKAKEMIPDTMVCPTADEIINEYTNRSGVKLLHLDQNEAYYSPSRDAVVVPNKDQFRNASQYYGVVFHELAHSTGHESRLDRLAKLAAFAINDYSKEELVAETTSAALIYHCGIENNKTFRNSTAYIQGWLNALRNDKRMIVYATSQATKAFNYILNREEAIYNG